jgi:hypothetical protein
MEEKNRMSRMKAFMLASCVGLFGAALAPTLHADEWNKRTILTVNEAIQVPGRVLEPGQYVMKLLDSPSNRHIVQIYDRDEQHLITTVLTIPNYRLQPTGKTQFGWWETPAGQPKALRSWFYPGDNFGQEFAYPKNEAVTIAAAVHQNVPTTYATSESDLTTARVGTIDQVGTEHELDSNYSAKTPAATPTGTMAAQTPAQTPAAQTPAQTPVQTAQNNDMNRSTGNSDMAAATPANTGSANRQRLPRTASPYPMVAMFGLVSLLGAAVVTVAAKR